MTIFFLDDHQIVIDGLIALMSGEPDLTVAGSTTDPQKALQMLQSTPADVVLTDLHMPGMDGLEFAKRLLKMQPEAKVIALSMHGDLGIAEQLLAIGGAGFVLKDAGKNELLAAIYAVAKGRKYFSPDLSPSPAFQKRDEKKPSLTLREIEIVRLISQEKSNAEIATELFISERTVESHRKNIFTKTGTKTAIGLVKWAMAEGLV